VVAAVGSKGQGKEDILTAIAAKESPENTFRIDYGPLESYLEIIEKSLATATDLADFFYSPRWLAVKLMEGDSGALDRLKSFHPLASALEIEIEEFRQRFEADEDETPEGFIAIQRHQRAGAIDKIAVKRKELTKKRESLTNRIDKIACHRYFGPLLLLGIVYLLYELAIVQGYNLTNYTWPLLAKFRQFVDQILPASGFIDESHLRGLALWIVDSVNGLLNYVPIFFILFALIAVIEDVGYMPRMAFILDRVFRRFGLHGQSTLPLILSGVIVGGCCVPGVMACKGIADEKARFATILISPLMNCLAKTPFYLLLIGIYFPAHRTIAFLFISTITIFIALPVAKVLTLTVLKGKESAPFVMEMPRYHLPTFRGVMLRACERVWLYVKKITSIVVAVAVVVYVLLQFPGLSPEREIHFQAEVNQALTTFQTQVEKQGFAEQLPKAQYLVLMQYWKDYKNATVAAGGNKERKKTINQKFKEKNSLYYGALKVGHAGTLDPFATGLLIILLGQGTKLSHFLMAGKKKYLATMRLGVETDTLDPTGRVVRTSVVPQLTPAEIRGKAKDFVGNIEQTPPRFSAVKYKGTRAYKLARKGLDVDLKKRIVSVYSLQILSVRLPDVTMKVTCSSGTYIRSLANALSSSVLLQTGARSLLRDKIIPLRAALPGMYEIQVGEPLAKKVRNGYQPSLKELNKGLSASDCKDGYVKLMSADDLVAIMKLKENGGIGYERLKIERVFS
jgi:tRNA pseudouridine(55) synthase